MISQIADIVKRFMFGKRRLKELDSLEGHLGWKEGHLLYKIAHSLKDNSVIVEIGAFKGKSTCYIAEGIGAKQIQFYTIDTWYNDTMPQGRQDVYSDFWANINPYQEKIQPLRGYSYEVKRNWPEERKIDFLWVDGDRSYKGVKRDIQD